MTRLLILVAVALMLNVDGFSQSETGHSNENLIKVFRKAGSWSKGDTSFKIRDAKLNGCELGYEILTRTTLSNRTGPSERTPSFAEKTDVDANADLSKNFINARFVSFSLSAVDIDDVVVENGIAHGTSLIRVPLRNSFAVISAKNAFGKDVVAIGDPKRPTIVVRTDSAEEFVRVFTSAVRACKN